MKYLLFFTLVVSGSRLGGMCISDRCYEVGMTGCNFQQQQPFYFVDPVPKELSINKKVNLSFFVNGLVVSEYRFRLQIPAGGRSKISNELQSWSPWIKDKMANIKVPVLDIGGDYRFVIEFKSLEDNKNLIFVKHFYVNSPSSVQKEGSILYAGIKNVPAKPGNVSKSEPTAYRNPIARSARYKVAPIRKISIPARRISIHPLTGSADLRDFIYIHDNNVSDAARGNLITGTDQYGNTLLHQAIILGETSYARSLIYRGADLNLKNKIGLSPLHLAVFLNNREEVTDLLKRGSNVNLKGNEGYTPLHIAAEMNNFDIARDLLQYGAKINLKTRQKFRPAAIARIQENFDMVRFIRTKGTYQNMGPGKSIPPSIIVKKDKPEPGQEVSFILPYDTKLARQWHSNKILQIISIPALAISTTGTIWLHIEANRSFSQYKTAETEAEARHFYDETLRLDRFTCIPGTISLASLYGLIHSTIKKRNITDDMRKNLY